MAMIAGEFLLGSAVINLVRVDEELMLKAWSYFKKQDDKRYSFTDCTSFALMKEMRLTHCLAFDRHFEQAGFRLFGVQV